MPGPEDYPYVDPEGPPQVSHAEPEVSMADSNPAFYPPEQKSEPLLTEDEKKYLAEKEETEASKGGEDVVDGQGETVITKDEVEAAKSEPEKTAEEPTPAKKNIPKSTSK